MAPAKAEPVVPLPYKLVVGGIAGVLGTSIILCAALRGARGSLRLPRVTSTRSLSAPAAL
jgi:hypothetical protein